MNIKNIIIMILLIFLIYSVYIYFIKASQSSIVKIQDATQKTTIPNNKLLAGSTDNYTYSSWIYVSDYDYNYGHNKSIIYRKTKGHHGLNTKKKGGSPYVYLNKSLNNLTVAIDIMKPNRKIERKLCTIKNIPLQTWVNVIVTLDTRSLDIYINGKLRKTCVFNHIPAGYSLTSGLTVCGSDPNDSNSKNGFRGNIGNIEFLPDKVSPIQAYNIYRRGMSEISANMSLDYQIKGVLLKNHKQIGSITLG
jgi:hypothetical protein